MDALSLTYPDIQPKYPKGQSVENAVIRSVYSYEFGASNYIVEIAVYRTWPKGNMAVEPKIESSMSMFHKVWEWQMEDRFHTSSGRNWDPQLKCFFEDQDTQPEGMPGFQKAVKFLVSNCGSPSLKNKVRSFTT